MKGWRGGRRLRFQPLPVEPCRRFSRTRLSDVLHRRRSAGARQSRKGRGAMTVPHKVISPRLSGDPQVTSLMPQIRLRLWRLPTNPASRSRAYWLIASNIRAEFP